MASKKTFERDEIPYELLLMEKVSRLRESVSGLGTIHADALRRTKREYFCAGLAVGMWTIVIINWFVR